MKYGVQMDINGRQMRIVHLNGQTVGDGPTVCAEKNVREGSSRFWVRSARGLGLRQQWK